LPLIVCSLASIWFYFIRVFDFWLTLSIRAVFSTFAIIRRAISAEPPRFQPVSSVDRPTTIPTFKPIAQRRFISLDAASEVAVRSLFKALYFFTILLHCGGTFVFVPDLFGAHSRFVIFSVSLKSWRRPSEASKKQSTMWKPS
jgi:hypothetical protein